MDAEAGIPPGRGPDEGARGRRRKFIVQRQRDEFLRLLVRGKGRDQAIAELGLSYRQFRNTCERLPGFLRAVRSAQRSAQQELLEIARMVAKAENPDLLYKLIDRDDRGKALTQARRDKATADRRALRESRKRLEVELRERALDRALTLHLAELKAKSDAERSGAAKPDGPAEVEKLSPEKLDAFRALAREILGPDSGPP